MNNAPVTFPAVAVPADPDHARLLGLYPQRQEGLLMQRIRVFGGRLTARQWVALAGIARKLTPNVPLHLTTRQDIEIHGLDDQTVPQGQQMLDHAGLTGLGACGDTIRNVTVCPCSGVLADAPDLLPLARQLTELFQSQKGAFAMPRKFKISLSACSAGCGQPWINDMGFVVTHHEGEIKFRVMLAGSLGAKPGAGIAYHRLLDPNEALPLVLAAFRLFEAHGDREHRTRARLRHVRERLGDVEFLELLDREFASTSEERNWPDVKLVAPDDIFPSQKILYFADGNIDADSAEAIGTLAGRDDLLRVRLGNHHQIFVFARDDKVLDDALVETHLESFTQPGFRVVACPGNRWCSHGLGDTGKLASAVRKRLDGVASKDTLIAISGCPNGCAHNAVGDVGAVGGLTGPKDDRQEVWNISAGGERGLGPALAQPVASKLPLDEAVAKIADCL